MPRKKRFQAHLDADLLERLIAEAQRQRVSISQVLRQLIIKQLARDCKKGLEDRARVRVAANSL